MIWGSEDSYSEKFKYSCNQCDHQATGNKHCNEREREGQECPPYTISILVLIQFNVPSVLVFVNLQHYLKESLPIIWSQIMRESDISAVHVNTNPETRENSTLTYRWSIKEAEEVLQSVWIQGQYHSKNILINHQNFFKED